jgi:transcriptional regulator with XRE-family HTH domain
LFNSKRQLTFDEYCQVNINKLKTTGEIIREQREKKELLLRQVAAKLDIDTAILSKIERGERKATREQIVKLAGILDLKKDDLLIQYLSENIAYEIADDDLAKQALKVAEKRVDYIKKNRK